MQKSGGKRHGKSWEPEFDFHPSAGISNEFKILSFHLLSSENSTIVPNFSRTCALLALFGVSKGNDQNRIPFHSDLQT